MRKTTRGKGWLGGTAVAAVIAGLALLQSLGLAAVWGRFPQLSGRWLWLVRRLSWPPLWGHRGPVSPMEGDPGR